MPSAEMPQHKPSLLLYIHGFNSSSRSHKANVMAEYCAEHRPDIKVLVPQLPSFPAMAAAYLKDVVEQHKRSVPDRAGGQFVGWLSIDLAKCALWF